MKGTANNAIKCSFEAIRIKFKVLSVCLYVIRIYMSAQCWLAVGVCDNQYNKEINTQQSEGSYPVLKLFQIFCNWIKYYKSEPTLSRYKK